MYPVIIAALSIILLLVVIVLINIFTPRRIPPTYEEVAQIIEDWINDKGGPGDWDTFICVKHEDPYIAQIQDICLSIPDEYPSPQKGGYSSEEGYEVLRNMVIELRKKSRVNQT